MSDHHQQIQENTNKLWAVLKETIDHYQSTECMCAFPRFHFYIGIDCVDYGGSFYMSETEGLIHYAKQVLKKIEGVYEQYACAVCGSVYQADWQDFSIHVSRSVMRIIDQKTELIGAEPINPTPFVVGFFGHTLPKREEYQQFEPEEFKKYLWELKK